MPDDRSENRSDDGYEMFTVRVNVENPTGHPLGFDSHRSDGRLKIHVRHVNSGDEATRFALDDALGWLRGRVASLFQKSGRPVQPSKSSDPAKQ